MEGTASEGRATALPPTKATYISVMMVRGGSASHKRSLRDGFREDWGPGSRQVQKGDWVRGLVAGLRWGASGRLLERRTS